MVALDIIAARNRLRRIEIEATQEYRQAAKQNLLGLGQQGVRPVHRGAQCLLAPHRSACTAGQEPEAVVEAVDDLDQRQGADTRRGEFDRQRHAVETPADVRYRRRVSSLTAKSGLDVPGAIDEQLDGLVCKRQRRHLPRELTRGPDGFAAGSQQRHAGTRTEQCGNDRADASARCSQLSSNTSIRAVGDEPHERVHGRTSWLIGQPERTSDSERDKIGMGDRSQVDVPDAVSELVDDLSGDLYARDASYPAPPSPVSVMRRCSCQQLAHLRHLGAAAHKSGELRGQTLRR